MGKHSKKARRAERRHYREWLAKDRLTVRLTMLDDYPHGDIVMAEVHGRGAEEWADHDQTIAGDTWEGTGDDSFVYAMPCNHAGLVEELRAEGYSLDLSEYQEPESDCESVDCTDKECGWKAEASI